MGLARQGEAEARRGRRGLSGTVGVRHGLERARWARQEGHGRAVWGEAWPGFGWQGQAG